MPATIGGIPFWLVKALLIGLGAVFGSFANVLIYRIPRAESVIRPGSRCPACGRPLRWYENIPVVSFIGLLGRCRSCKAAISLRYPLVELCGAVLSLASGYRALAWTGPAVDLAGLLAAWAFVFAFCFLLLVITFVDLEHWRIPPVFTLPGAALGLLCSIALGDLTRVRPLDALAGAALGAIPLVLLIEGYRRLTGREGMGYGDVFLMGMIGAYLGYTAIPFVLFASSVQGLLIAVPSVWLKGRTRPPWEDAARLSSADSPQAEPGRPGLRFAAIPFGPFLAVSALEWLFFHEALIQRLSEWVGSTG